MSDPRLEYVPDDEPTFEDDLRWARRQPAYWADKLKLDVADAVSSPLEQQHLSRAELARRMGTSPAFITKILRGNHNWSLHTLAKAGAALGLQWLVVTAPIEAVARTFTRLEFPDARGVPSAVQRARRNAAAEWLPAEPIPSQEPDGRVRISAAA